MTDAETIRLQGELLALQRDYDALLQENARLVGLLEASLHTLRSYQYGNQSPDLAEDIAENLAKELEKGGE